MNIDLMSHPLNWITLAIWVIFVGLAIHFLSPLLPQTYDKD